MIFVYFLRGYVRLLIVHFEMSNIRNTEKRARATNFNFREKELLLNIALENRHILENKESNAVSWKNKNKCWLNIAETYNSTTTGCVRILILIFCVYKI